MENDKLVRLSDVIETVENQCSYGNMWGNENLTLIDAYNTVDELSDLSAVDAVVRHGRWIDTEDGGYCSECNCDMPMYREDWMECVYCKTPYCPNCGARMDGKEEHNVKAD